MIGSEYLLHCAHHKYQLHERGSVEGSLPPPPRVHDHLCVAHSRHMYGVFQGLGTAHDGCQGQEERKTHPAVLLEPNLGVGNQELQGQDVPDVLQALGQGAVTSHHPHCTGVHRLPAQYMAEELVFRTALSN